MYRNPLRDQADFDCGKNRPDMAFALLLSFVIASGDTGDIVDIEGREPFVLGRGALA